MAPAGFLGKSTGTSRKDLDWKTAEPRDGWGDAATNGRGGPKSYSVVGGSLIRDRLRILATNSKDPEVGLSHLLT
jgi:hypothetical protein